VGCGRWTGLFLRHSGRFAFRGPRPLCPNSVIQKSGGIGLARTGTATLCDVFRRLHNLHFPSLETADAAADDECALFYRYLDEGRPAQSIHIQGTPRVARLIA